MSPELDLRLQAYFAIYHIHPDIKSPLEDEELILDTTAAKLEEFKAYLESKADLIVDEDIYMQYEGLTYVLSVDIDKNEKIKHIFEKQWLLDLRAELSVAIETLSRPE